MLAAGAVRSWPYRVDRSSGRTALIVSDGVDDDIAILPAGKGEIRRLAPAPGADWYPRFSPHGEWVLFESSRASFRDLYKVNVTTGKLVRLTDDEEGNFDGAWSPDGAYIAFASSREQQLDLFVMRSDGSEQRRLTDHPGDSVKPAWSPDGSWIAFISARDDFDDLFLIRPDGSGLRNVSRELLEDGEEVIEFEWHPTKAQIVYVTRRPPGRPRLRLLDVAGGASTILSDPEVSASMPSWSPDGRFIAYARTEDGRSDIWFMEAGGGEGWRVTQEKEGAWRPRWNLGGRSQAPPSP